MFKLFTPKKLLLTAVIAGLGLAANAQEFGANPPSIKWRQVNIPAARVIFPYGLDSVGIRVASIIQQMNPVVKPTIGYKQKQVNIVLQNQTIMSNGFVMLAPFRSEFYLTPLQNNFELGSLPWDEQLTIHEFRHVQQYNNFNVGLSKALHIVFGESGQLLGNSLAIPDWFSEGDAVLNETHVSDQGRGRLPYFFNGYRSLWEAGKNYSWMKLRNGSYLDYVPDWYPLGYMMNAYGREKYGPMFWRNVTHDAAAFKSPLYPLQSAVKHYSGISYSQFQDSALDYFKQQIALPPNRVVGPKFKKSQHFIADLEYPAVVNDSTVIYVKTTYKTRPAFVMKTGNKERVIRVKNLGIDRQFDYSHGKIIYGGYHPDLRWGYRDFNELQIIDVATGRQTQITHRTKYFSPAFNEDGSKIAVVQYLPSAKCNIHILDDEGKLLQEVPNPDNFYYTYPHFYNAETLVAGVRNKQGKMTVATVDIKTGNTQPLLDYNIAPLSFLSIQKDTVYFTATTGLNDRLYALSVNDKKLYRLQSDTLENAIGNYEASVKDNTIAWVGFTAYGYQLHRVNKQAIQWEQIKSEQSPGYLSDFGISALKKDSAADLLANVKTQPFKTSKYSKLHNFFNFHSILPDFEDPNYTLSLEGENVINTFQSQLSGTYNRDEGYKQIGYEAVYGALFPYISAGVDYTFDRKGYYRGENIYWNESAIHAGLELPLNLSQGRHSTNLQIGSDVYYSSQMFQEAFRSRFKDGSYTYLNNYITFTNSILQPVQNIYPHLAQSITINYKKGIISQYNNQFLASGNFYFPGLLTNHNFVINLAYQQRSKNSVIDFSNDFPFSRGYTVYNLYKMDKASVNYHFPIAYPDAGFANLLYLLRLRGNLFFDYSKAQDFYTNNIVFKGNFRSTGAELFFDTQWFNQLPLTFGLRYTRLLDTDLGGRGQNRIELVVPLTIF